jgi:hypothetical protein
MVERGAPDDDDALVGSQADVARFVVVFEVRAGEVWRYLAARLGSAGADELLSEVFCPRFRESRSLRSEAGLGSSLALRDRDERLPGTTPPGSALCDRELGRC